ncbi:hypothetical protein EGW08_012100 [Elysia chlorotica]|uniref:SSD domain-containing protein n=1 Tax=Elysia chlorotica TaxID=188477 RepID=A0A3S1BBE1_ELYCH|nr:hypothetical protein EGW08_012100 [Elysia chlorotica]
MDLYENSYTLVTPDGITLSDICLKAGSLCVVYSILEIWSYDSTTIRSLTQDQIISGVNSVTTSPVYGNAIDVSKYLGTHVTNSSGSIVSAQAAAMTWFTTGLADHTSSWENEFVNFGLAGHPDITALYVLATKSFRVEAKKAAYSDAVFLVGGHIVVIGFVVSVLGNFNLMEQRIWLTLTGFISIGFAELVAISLSSALGQGYGPIQNALPFLLLGLGVDDMFVIIRALNCLSPEDQTLDIPDRMGPVLRHAGVSITVTSVTDFVAFIIGSTTIIPALRSFCVYAAFGVATLYILQATFFTAFVSIDLRRRQKERDACLFACLSHPSPPYIPNECSKKQLVPLFFKHGLARAISKWPVKVTVLLISGALISTCIYGVTQLEQYFDRNWLLTDSSYATAFIRAMNRHFPEDGMGGSVFCGNVDYWGRQSHFEALNVAMKSSSVFYENSTDSWFSALTAWLATTTDSDVAAMLDANKYPVSKAAFMNLTYRMTTEIATRTNAYIVFSTTPELDIKASLFPYRHIQLEDPLTQIQAMDKTRAMVEAAGFSPSECFAYSSAYLIYETNKVIRDELYRNIGLALIAIFVVTLILIAHFRTSVLVLCTVISTLVEVAGTMYFWGLTIDTVTSIILIVSVGLSVDYSAHIGHMFMTISGSKQYRATETVSEMGPAVFYGGFSTFLAFSLLIFSDGYIFTTFFEINFLVVLYGVFNGLVLLPILLSWFGPPSHAPANKVGTVNGGFVSTKSEHAHNYQQNGAIPQKSSRKDDTVGMTPVQS